MRKCFLPCLFFILASVSGCSTGVFLKPVATTGTYSTVNPACPGAKEVVEFAPAKQNWVLLRVYATPPGRWSSNGTELRIRFRMVNRGAGLNLLSVMFPSEERKRKIKERSSQEYLITTSRPTVTVITSDGLKQKIRVPLFEQATNLGDNEQKWWGPGIQISPNSLERFTVLFPDIFVNGEKIEIPPIHFKKDQHRYAPVLNC